jgi:predicted MFS family arabinose efflux permease
VSEQPATTRGEAGPERPSRPLVSLFRRFASGHLWNHHDFLLLWGGQTISLFGSQITLLALPTMAILLLSASPLQVSLIQTLQYLPFLALGVFVGGVVERLRLRHVMIAAHLGRMVSLASIPVVAGLGLLTLGQIYVVSAVNGVCLVLFMVAYESYLPDLIGRPHLVEANAKLQMSSSASAIGGLPLAGALIQVLSATRAVAVDASAFLAAALTITLIRRPESRRGGAAGTSPFLAQVWQGIRLVRDHWVLRRTTCQAAMVNFGVYMNYSILLVFAYRDVGLSPAAMGVVYGVGSVGWFIGAVVVPALSRALGVGRTLAIAGAMIGVGILGFPMARFGQPILVMTLAQLIVTVFWPMYLVTEVSLRQAITPAPLLSRTNATVRTAINGAIPLATFTGGLVANARGVLTSMTVAALVAAAGSLWILSGRVLSVRSARDVVGEVAGG